MTYGHVTPEIIAELEKIAPGRVVVGKNVNPDYGRDEMPIYGTSMPDVTIDVLSTEEVSAIMKICYKNSIPVTTRGAGTGLVGGCVPVLGGIVLCTTHMDKILNIDEEQFCAIAQPGVLLKTMQEAALERGLMYPPDPGQKLATVGGNVSTNAGGMRAIKYGTTKDWVDGMTVVLPNGDILDLGSSVKKSSMGYNLTQLITGSEGTLAIITELKLRLVKAAKLAISVLAPFEVLPAALETVPKIFAGSFRPTCLEFFGKDILEMSEEYVGRAVYPKEVEGTPIGAYLLLVFEGETMDEIEPTLEKITDFLLENGAMDVMIADTPVKIKDIWEARGAFFEAIFDLHKLYDENDVVVPINRIAEFVEFFTNEAKQYDFDVTYLGHAGDGNLHTFAISNDMDPEEFKRQVYPWMVAMYAKAKEMHGEITGEHGVGSGKVEFFRDYVGPEIYEISRKIKHTFDPKLILNPGKVCFTAKEMKEV